MADLSLKKTFKGLHYGFDVKKYCTLLEQVSYNFDKSILKGTVPLGFNAHKYCTLLEQTANNFDRPAVAKQYANSHLMPSAAVVKIHACTRSLIKRCFST